MTPSPNEFGADPPSDLGNALPPPPHGPSNELPQSWAPDTWSSALRCTVRNSDATHPSRGELWLTGWMVERTYREDVHHGGRPWPAPRSIRRLGAGEKTHSARVWIWDVPLHGARTLAAEPTTEPSARFAGQRRVLERGHRCRSQEHQLRKEVPLPVLRPAIRLMALRAGLSPIEKRVSAPPPKPDIELF